MAKVLSSISGNLISAASAGYAPTNSGDVSAIASAYQVVSATATQLYAGTAHVTSVNGDPISASRAGNAANASMATSAYYDGTGRLISSLPDAATVSSIASSYAESAASGKLDKTAQLVSATAGDGTYVTSINGMGLSGQGGGGAQVVTSTASASYYSAGTKTGISAINGSAIIAMSALGASNAGTALYADTAYYAQTAYYDANGRALTSIGTATGGGSVTSPSGTIFVKNGTAIEGTNSAVVVDQTSVGKTSILPIQGYAIGPTGMGVLTYGNLDESGMNLVFMIAGTYYGDDATVIISGRDSTWNFASASGLIVDGDTSANIPLGTVQSQLSASSYYWINLANSDLSGVKAPGYDVTGVRELAWKSAVDDVTTTVATNSASWSQGLKYGDKVSNGSNTIGLGKSANLNTDAGIYLSSTHGSGFYKVNEMTLNRTSYGETVNFNLGSAGSQVRVSASGSRGGYFSAWNDNTSAALMVSGSKPVLKLGAELATDSSVSSWNDCYDTVSANSASWGGGATGDYVEKSATEVAIGYSNSAMDTSFAQGERNTASSYSFAQGCYNSAINAAAVFGLFNLHGDGDTYTGDSAAFVIGDGEGPDDRHDLMLVTKDGEITMYSSVFDTVGTGIMSSIRAISAAATGGVDSATVSAIASAYQVVSSTASGSGEIFGQTAYYATEINGLTLSAQEAALATYATNAGSAGAAPTNSSEVSAIASGYASGKADSSSLSSYALSADVSGTVDVVSTQSANWGGSALALSAGPGVSLTKSGNTLIAGLDETVLWSGSIGPTNTAEMAYPLTAFERVRVTWFDWDSNGSYHIEEFAPLSPRYPLCGAWFGSPQGVLIFHLNMSADSTYTTISFTDGVFAATTGTSYNSATNSRITKIVGINRTAGV